VMRVVVQVHQDHLSHVYLCKTILEVEPFSLDVELNRLGFCSAGTRSTEYFGVYTSGEKCKKSFTLFSISLLQYAEEPNSYQLAVWPEIRSRAEKLLLVIREGCEDSGMPAQSLHFADSRAKLTGYVFLILVKLCDPTLRTRCMRSLSALLKSVDLLVLRGEDKGILMPHLGKLVQLFDFINQLELADQYMIEQACVVHLMAHCVAGDEHRSSELLTVDGASLSETLRRSLQADSRRAHRENVAMQNDPDKVDEVGSDTHPTIRLQNSCLFCLNALGLPQTCADMQTRGCVLEKPERVIGGLSDGDAARLVVTSKPGAKPASKPGGSRTLAPGLLTHPAVFPSYTMSFVLAIKKEACVKSGQPRFQALVQNECNLPHVYVSLEDFTVWVQVPTVGGRLESCATKTSVLDEASPLSVMVVVDGLLVHVYINGVLALRQPKRLSGYAEQIRAGQISCGRSLKLVEASLRGEKTKNSDPLLSGAMLMLRWYPKPMVRHEVESKSLTFRAQSSKILKRRIAGGPAGAQETPLTVYNIIEVTKIALLFTQQQLSDEAVAASGRKKSGLQDLMDPDTIMWMVLALGTAAMYLPHQHPSYLELIKKPFVKVMQMVANIMEHAGTGARDQLSTYQQAFISAAIMYVAFVLESPRGRTILQDEIAAILVIKINSICDTPIDLSDYVVRNCQSLSAKLGVLLLHAKQEAPATLALILDTILSRLVNDVGVIYKEDLQEFLVDFGLGALIGVLELAGRRAMDLDYQELHKKSLTSRMTSAQREEFETTLASERKALTQVQKLGGRLHRQLFLQLHHIMDEVIHGLPLDERSMLALVKM
ncbi:unnamed protein product, partial [Polarella glacialis]